MKHEIPRVLVHPSKVTGLAFWRILWPMYQLGMRGEVICTTLQNFILDALPYVSSNVILLQRFVGRDSAGYLEKVASLREKGDFRMIYDVDDVIFFDSVPDYHYGKKATKVGDDKDLILKKTYEEELSTIAMMELCDEITVLYPFFKRFLQK